MTGWRLGYIAANAEVAKGCEKLQGQFTSGATAVTQRAAIVALTGDLRPSEEMTEEFTRRRKRVLEIIKEVPGIKCFEPEGAFYIFPDVSYYYGKSDGTTKVNNACRILHVPAEYGACIFCNGRCFWRTQLRSFFFCQQHGQY